MNEMHYIYAHYKTGELNIPFYIGKGNNLKKRRAWSDYHRNPHWHNVVKKHGRDVRILAENLSEDAAFWLERHLIGMFGRADLGNGPLVNMTDGGDGAIQSDEIIEKARQSRPSRKYVAWNKGIPQCPEQVLINSLCHMGQIPWNKGMTMPLDWVHPMKGKTHKDSTKEHWSKIRKGRIWGHNPIDNKGSTFRSIDEFPEGWIVGKPLTKKTIIKDIL